MTSHLSERDGEEMIVGIRETPHEPSSVEFRRVRHKKRGSTYRVLHGAVMQSTHWRDTYYKVPADGRTVVVYQSEDDGSVWVRPSEEFEDGRFEDISAASPGSLANLADANQKDPSLSEAREEIERLRGASREIIDGLDDLARRMPVSADMLLISEAIGLIQALSEELSR